MFALSCILLESPHGKLEVCVEKPIHHPDNPDGVALICHPHPLHGGTMTNKVVTTLAKAFRELNCLTVRFNYRGVGQSDGHFDKGMGETEDTLFMLDWINKIHRPQKIYMAGFSFGAFVSLRAASKTPLQLAHLLTVAPAVEHEEYNNLHPRCPWTVIIAENDTIAKPKPAYDWVALQNPKPHVLSFEGASHFFDGMLVEFKDRIKQHLS